MPGGRVLRRGALTLQRIFFSSRTTDFSRAAVRSQHGLDLDTLPSYYEHRPTYDAQSELGRACTEGRLDDVAYLLEHDKKRLALDLKTEQGFTFLMLAAHFGHTHIIHALASAGSSLHERTQKGLMAHHLSAASGHFAATKFLLDCGVDVNEESKTGLSPLALAVSSDRAGVAAMLLEHGADMEHRNKSGRTPLCFAASHNAVECAELLLRAGARVEVKDCAGFTPLMAAAAQGHLELIEVLLGHGAAATLNRHSKRGYTALTIAASHGARLAVECLVQHGATIDAVDKARNTALCKAVFKCHRNIVKILLEAGANVNHVPSSDYPLLRAVKTDDLFTFRLLLKHGADPDLVGQRGETARNAAADMPAFVREIARASQRMQHAAHDRAIRGTHATQKKMYHVRAMVGPCDDSSATG